AFIRWLQQERETYLFPGRWIDRLNAFVSELEVSELQQELAIALRHVGSDDVCAPACWTTIKPWRYSSTTKEDAGFRMSPFGSCRLDNQTSIKTCLLVR